MESLRKALGSQADMVLVALVVGILVVLFAPIPGKLFDFVAVATLVLAVSSLALLVSGGFVYVAVRIWRRIFPSRSAGVPQRGNDREDAEEDEILCNRHTRLLNQMTERDLTILSSDLESP